MISEHADRLRYQLGFGIFHVEAYAAIRQAIAEAEERGRQQALEAMKESLAAALNDAVQAGREAELGDVLAWLRPRIDPEYSADLDAGLHRGCATWEGDDTQQLKLMDPEK